jgi:hypothetical protein
MDLIAVPRYAHWVLHCCGLPCVVVEGGDGYWRGRCWHCDVFMRAVWEWPRYER